MALLGRFASVSVYIHLNTQNKTKILKGKKIIKNGRFSQTTHLKLIISFLNI